MSPSFVELWYIIVCIAVFFEFQTWEITEKTQVLHGMFPVCLVKNL